MAQTTALCHPNRKHLARGMCTQCYQNWNLRPHLHPDLQTVADQWSKIKEKQSEDAGARRSLKKQRKDYIRNYRMEKRYGLTEETYQQMKQAQDNACFICKETHPCLYVDHNHATGKVRKLLCPGCNTFVGLLEKRGHLIDRALYYIASEP